MNNSGAPVGTKHSDPMFNTRTYVRRMSDGTERELWHNVIAEDIFFDGSFNVNGKTAAKNECL